LLHAISLGSVLFALWLLLSGFFDPLLLGLGLASTVVIVLFANRMDVIDHEGHPIHLSWRGLFFWPWLSWQIILSNLDVAMAILRPKMAIRPKVFNIKASQVTELGHVIYANSITLTPGTVTLDLKERNLMIHSLTVGSEAGLLTGEMDRRVHILEGEADGTVEGVE